MGEKAITLEDVAAEIKFIDIHIAELEAASKSTCLMVYKRKIAQDTFDRMIALKRKNE